MSVHVSIHIQPIPIAVDKLPNGGENGGTHEDLRESQGVGSPKVSRGDASVEQRPQGAQTRGDDLAMVDIGELRKFPTLGDEHPHDRSDPVIPDDIGIHPGQEPAQELRGTPFHIVSEEGNPLSDQAAHDSAKELLLVLEIEIDRPLGDAGPLGDVVESRGGESLHSEHIECRREDLFVPLSLPRLLGSIARGLSSRSIFH